MHHAMCGQEHEGDGAARDEIPGEECGDDAKWRNARRWALRGGNDGCAHNPDMGAGDFVTV